jgi:hypothetical protein
MISNETIVPPRPPIHLSSLAFYAKKGDQQKKRIESSAKKSHPKPSSNGPRLPKVYQFICIADNGAVGDPEVPKKYLKYWNALEKHGMIKDITFQERTHEHCLRQIRAAFAHLSLDVFKFYRASGSEKYLTSLEDVQECQFDAFTLLTFERYVVGD